MRSPKRTGREHSGQSIRVLRGKKEEKVKIRLQNIQYFINPASQKGGNYDDLRNLRNYISSNPKLFEGKNVLNLFSNNGLTSVMFEKAGAKKIYSIEDSVNSINIHKDNLKNFDERKHKIVKLDIFKNLKNFLEETKERFDVILIDPPSLTSSSKDIHKAKNIYSTLIRLTLDFLEKKGILILCSCSNRIHKNEFLRICKESIERKGIKFKKPARLLNEIDHPVIDSFPEGDYLKVNIFFVE